MFLKFAKNALLFCLLPTTIGEAVRASMHDFCH